MPTRSPRPCNAPLCTNLTTDRYCEQHASLNVRPSAAKRGYGSEWRQIRARVLAGHGIPQSKWHLYDVDHRPPYNPAIDPDHNHYTLVPMLKGEHSSKTIECDGGFGR